MVDVKIVEAVACASSLATMASVDKKRRAAMVEEAMVGAIKKAQAEGTNDPEIIRGRMLEAREAVKAELR